MFFCFLFIYWINHFKKNTLKINSKLIIYWIAASWTAAWKTSSEWSQTFSRSSKPLRNKSMARTLFCACILKCILVSAGWGTVYPQNITSGLNLKKNKKKLKWFYCSFKYFRIYRHIYFRKRNILAFRFNGVDLDFENEGF